MDKQPITGAVCNVCGRALDETDPVSHRYTPCQRHPRALLRWIPRGSWKLILEDQKRLQGAGLPM